MEEAGGRRRTLAAFSSRDFRLLWGGQAISFVGDGAFTVALGWRVTQLTGKASSLGYVLALQSLAMLTTLLIGGVLADRYSRRLLMITSDLARAGVVAVFLVVDATGHLDLAVVLVLAACFGLADGFFQPAFQGIVPFVVDATMLPSASSWLGIARQSSNIVGPALAAAVYSAAGPSTVWAIEVGSFLVSASALALARPRITDAEIPRGIRHELAEGFRYVASVPFIWTGIVAACVILMFGMAPFNALLPRIVHSHFDRGVGSYGFLFSLMACGMVLGSLVWARWAPRRHRIVICYASFAIGASGLATFGLAPWFWLAACAVFWRGFWIGIGISSWMTLVIEHVPERLLSRVFSFDYFGSSGLTPVGYALAGGLATVVAPTTILAVGGTIAVALWCAPLLSRDVRAGTTRAPSSA
ncbi:MAG TPA: MFS transporter [Gaiellaceae bacterium]